MLPQGFSKFWSSETPFPAFWKKQNKIRARIMCVPGCDDAPWIQHCDCIALYWLSEMPTPQFETNWKWMFAYINLEATNSNEQCVPQKIICKLWNSATCRRNTIGFALVRSSIVSRWSPDLAPRMGLQNDAKRYFAKRTCRVNTFRNKCRAWCLKWRQITKVISIFFLPWSCPTQGRGHTRAKEAS